GPNLCKNAHQAGSDQVLVFRIGKLEHVEADAEIRICGIEIDYVLHSLFGDSRENILDQFAVWVDHADAFAVDDILNHQVVDQRRFAGTGFADDVHVLPPIVALDAEKTIRLAKIGFAEINNILLRIYSHKASIPDFLT